MAFSSLILLYFTIILFSKFLCASCQKDTEESEFLFLASKDNVVSCVTNSNKPLFWAAVKKSEDYAVEQQVSKFTRRQPSSPMINCNFDLSESCTSFWTGANSIWKTTNSLDMNLNVSSLLDFRWESLQLIETRQNHQRNAYRSEKTSRKLSSSSFEIGISFRVKNQGQIFLCESTNSIENCRVFIIDVDSSTQSLSSYSAECGGGNVLSADFNVTEQCSNNSYPVTVYFDSVWTHVKLRKTDEYVALQLIDGEFDLKIAEAEFNSGLNSSSSHVVMLNSNSNGDLWKFHDYQFIYTTVNSQKFQLQQALKPDNSSDICMFVYFCPDCYLRVRMIDAETGKAHKPVYIDYLLTSDWRQVIINTSEIQEQYYLEIATALNRGNNSLGFWAIDHVRYCHVSEYRMLDLPKSSKKQGAQCELVPKTRQNPENLHAVKLEPHNFTEVENCPENTLGSICLPCHYIYNQANNCSGVRVCENNAAGSEVCYCTGFDGTGVLEKQLCDAHNNLTDFSTTDDEKSSSLTSTTQTFGTSKVILIVGVSIGATLIFVFVLICVVRKVKRSFETSEYVTPDLIQGSQLPSYKRLLSKQRKSTAKIIKKPVPVAQFENYVQEIVRSGEINDQLQSLIPEQRLYSVIRGPANSGYEQPIDIVFVDGYKSPKAFVILQGKKNSIKPPDFWHEVFRKNVKNIVWIAMDEKAKLWPELHGNWDLNGICIETLLVDKNRTTLELRGAPRNESDTQTKTVHLNSIFWESHIPLCSQKLSKISLQLLKVTPSSKSPVLIFNNTGDLNKGAAILLCDSCLRMAAREGQVDIYGQLKALANQIPPFFANFKYYPLVHYTVLESFTYFDSEVDCQELSGFIDNDLYKLHIRYVQHLLPDSTKKVIKEHQAKTNVYNFPDISAVYVNGFRACKKFIVAPQPLMAHFEEFWNLVVEFEVPVIITLNQHNNKFMQNSAVIFAGRETFNHHEVFVGSINEKPITVVCLNNWPFTEALPRDLESFIEFFEKSISISASSSNVLVMCRDGVDATGVYVALSYLVEQMKTGKVCDVPKAIQNARRSRNEFVRKKAQVKFLFRAANAYMQMFPEKFEK